MPRVGDAGPSPIAPPDQAAVIRRAIAYLATCDPAVSEQGGHDDTYWPARVACYGFDLGEELGFQILRENFNPRCQPPWSEGDLRHKCRDADTKPFGKPRGWLRDEPPPERNGLPTARAGNSPAGVNETGGVSWELPIPLTATAAVPPFPVDLLPKWMGDFCRQLAEATQTPVDLVVMLVLAVAAAALARRYRVQVRDGWTEPVNLFAVVALPPGDRKSAVFAEIIAPVQAHEASERIQLAPVIAAKASERRVLEERLKNVEKKAAREDDLAARALLKEEGAALAKELDECRVPFAPQLYCDDVTPERLGQLLAQQGGRMLQASAEGTAFEIAKGRYSETANFDVYLKGHAGDPLRVGRVGRDQDEVDRPALSAALAVQPDVIVGLAEQASMRGRGFLARWLYAVPQSTVGRRRPGAAAVQPEVRTAYQDNMLRLWMLTPRADNSEVTLRLGSVGNEHILSLERWLEPQLAEGEQLFHLAGWANKLAGAVARIAGVLHVAEAIGRGANVETTVSDRAVSAAARIGRDYLLPHASAAFGVMGADEQMEKARKVWLSICRLCEKSENSEYSESAPPRFSRRNIHQANRCAFPSADQLDSILNILVREKYLRPTDGEPGKTGRGHKSPDYEVNPLALAAHKNEAPRTHRTHCIHSDESPGDTSEEPNTDAVRLTPE